MLKMSEVKTLDKAAIQGKIVELRKNLFDLRLQKATTNVEKSHLLKETRKDIARLLTAQNQLEGSK